MTYRDEVMKAGVDVTAAMIGFGALANILPPVAAALTIIWTALRIWESPTFQQAYGKLLSKLTREAKKQRNGKH